MKNIALALCILLSPLSYATYHDGDTGGSTGGGGGGYGGGSSGGAAALLLVGGLVYFMNRDTGEEETESTFIRRYKESNLTDGLNKPKNLNPEDEEAFSIMKKKNQFDLLS